MNMAMTIGAVWSTIVTWILAIWTFLLIIRFVTSSSVCIDAPHKCCKMGMLTDLLPLAFARAFRSVTGHWPRPWVPWVVSYAGLAGVLLASDALVRYLTGLPV